jgi:hypothetical protein
VAGRAHEQKKAVVQSRLFWKIPQGGCGLASGSGACPWFGPLWACWWVSPARGAPFPMHAENERKQSDLLGVRTSVSLSFIMLLDRARSHLALARLCCRRGLYQAAQRHRQARALQNRAQMVGASANSCRQASSAGYC